MGRAWTLQFLGWACFVSTKVFVPEYWQAFAYGVSSGLFAGSLVMTAARLAEAIRSMGQPFR